MSDPWTDVASPLEKNDSWAAVAEPVKERSTLSPVTQFASGFNEQLAKLYSLPSDVLEETAGRVISNITGMKTLKETGYEDPVAKVLTAGSVPPATPVERVMRRGGEETLNTIAMLVLPHVAAGRTAAQITAKTGLSSRIVNTMLNSIRQAAKTKHGLSALTAAETATGASAGIGLGTAEELYPGKPGAHMAGELAGGLAPSIAMHSPAMLAIRGGRALFRRFSPKAQVDAAREEAAKVMGEAMGTAETQTLDRTLELEKEIPGYQPSLAEGTQSPALRATQKQLEATTAGPELEEMAMRRRQNELAIANFANAQAPDADMDASYVVDVANRRVGDLRGRIEAEAQQIAKEQEAFAAHFGGVDRWASGETIRNKLTKARSLRKQEMSRMAERLGLNNVDMTGPFSQFRDDTANVFPNSLFTDARNKPRILKEIKKVKDKVLDTGFVDSTGKPITEIEPALISFDDWMNLRSRVTDDIRDAVGNANPSAKKVRTLVQLRKMIDESTEDMIEEMGGTNPELADNWRAFRKAYLEDYIKPFERGVAFKVRLPDGRGAYKIPEERVAQTFFQPGNITAARQFNTIFGNDPEAQANLAAVAVDSLRDAAVRDGRLMPNLMDSWIRKHASVLEEFPQIQDTVGSMREAVGALAARQTQLQDRTRQVSDSLLARQLSSYSKGSKTPEAVIDDAVKNPRLMNDLKASLRHQPEMLKALQRRVWDQVADLDSMKIEAFILANQKSLSQLFSPEHIKNIRTIADAKSRLEFVPRPEGKAFTVDPTGTLAKELGQGVPQIGSRIFAVKSGRIGPQYMMVDMFGRFFRGRAILEEERLLREALYNPEVARDLRNIALERAKGPEPAKRLNVWLFNLGIPSEDFAQAEGTVQ